MVGCNCRGSLGFLLGLSRSSSDLTLLLLVDPVPALELQKKNHRWFSQCSEISSPQLADCPKKLLTIIKPHHINQDYIEEFKQVGCILNSDSLVS
jgi:hypothetical protein